MRCTIKEKAANAIKIAVTGKHNIIFVGDDSEELRTYCNIIRECTPRLGMNESLEVAALYAANGDISYVLEMRENHSYRIKDVWIEPDHKTTLEAMYGGGAKMKAGEVSLAHNGILYMPELHAYNDMVTNMLRSPMSCKTLTLCRQGISKIFPANFQLVATCTEDSIKKLDPIVRRCDIVCHINDEKQDFVEIETSEIMDRACRAQTNAITRRGVFNRDLNFQTMTEVMSECEFDIITGEDRVPNDLLKIGRVAISVKDWRMQSTFDLEEYELAVELCGF